MADSQEFSGWNGFTLAPHYFALSLNAIGALFLVTQLFKRQKIHTDWFWWGFFTWWLIQGLWLVMMLGGLGFGSAMLGDSLREWVRIFPG